MASPRLIVSTSVLTMVATVGTSQLFVADVFTGTAGAAGRDSHGIQAGAPGVFVAGFECDSWYSGTEVEPCVSGDSNATHTAVLFGDSIGAQWASLLPEVFPAPDWRILVFTKSACAIADLEYYYKPAGGLYDVCTTWRNASIEYITKLEPDIVFIGSSSGYDFSEDQWVGGIERVTTKLAAASRQVVVIPGSPMLSFDGPSCIKEPYMFTRRLRDSQYMCEEAMTGTVSDDVAGYMALAASGASNVGVLDLGDLVCPGRRCAARSKEGLTVFRDQQHLTASFVVAQAPAVLIRLESMGAGPSFLAANP